MPSKRQPSKQRRAAQNRARSQSLAARSANAQQSPSPVSSSTASSGSGSSSAPPRRGGLLSNLLAPQQAGAARGSGGPTEVVGNPGRAAVIVALAISVGLAIAVLFVIPQPVDDRGDAVPPFFGGLHIRAREALTGRTIETTNESGIEAGGGAAVAIALLPVAICLGALLVYMRRKSNGQSLYWPMTIAMIVMALVVMMLQYSFAMPAMVALAIASFQVRKAEMPGRIADQAAAREARAAEAEAEPDPEDEYDDEDYDDEDYDEGYDEGELVDEDDDSEPSKEK